MAINSVGSRFSRNLRSRRDVADRRQRVKGAGRLGDDGRQFVNGMLENWSRDGIYGTARGQSRSESGTAEIGAAFVTKVLAANFLHAHPASSRRASVASSRIPASPSLRQGIRANFSPPACKNRSRISTPNSSMVYRQSAEKPGAIMARRFTPDLASSATVSAV